jgi:hypothetical protein
MTHSPALPATRLALRILILLNWIFGALLLTLLLVSFQVPEWTWRALGVGSAAAHAGTVAGMRAIMVLGLVGVPIAARVLRQLLRIVDSVRAGEPFDAANVGRLRAIAWSLLGLELLHLAVLATAAAVSSRELPLHLDGGLDLTGWLAILLLFVLAQVFHEGTRLREDLEGIV